MEELNDLRKILSEIVEERRAQRPPEIQTTVLKEEIDYSDIEANNSSCDDDEYDSEVQWDSEYTSEDEQEVEVDNQGSKKELEGGKNSDHELLTEVSVSKELSTSSRIEQIGNYLNEHSSHEENEIAEESTCTEADDVDLHSGSIPIENVMPEDKKTFPEFGRDFVILISALRQNLIHIIWELELLKEARISFFAGRGPGTGGDNDPAWNRDFNISRIGSPKIFPWSPPVPRRLFVGPGQQEFPLILTREEYDNKLAQVSIAEAIDSHMDLVRHKSGITKQLQEIRASLIRFEDFARISCKPVPNQDEVRLSLVIIEVIAKDGTNTMVKCTYIDPVFPNDNELMKVCLRLDYALSFLSEKLANARLLLKEKVTTTKEVAVMGIKGEEKR